MTPESLSALHKAVEVLYDFEMSLRLARVETGEEVAATVAATEAAHAALMAVISVIERSTDIRHPPSSKTPRDTTHKPSD